MLASPDFADTACSVLAFLAFRTRPAAEKVQSHRFFFG
jgi:hypothetical protein